MSVLELLKRLLETEDRPEVDEKAKELEERQGEVEDGVKKIEDQFFGGFGIERQRRDRRR